MADISPNRCNFFPFQFGHLRHIEVKNAACVIRSRKYQAADPVVAGAQSLCFFQIYIGLVRKRNVRKMGKSGGIAEPSTPVKTGFSEAQAESIKTKAITKMLFFNIIATLYQNYSSCIVNIVPHIRLKKWK